MKSRLIIATILARSKSSGLIDKNIKTFHKNHSLLEITINQALRLKLFDLIVFSSDSENYINLSKKVSPKKIFTIKRSKNLSNKSISKLPGIRDCLLKSEKYLNKRIDYVIDLAVTSPLRSSQNIIDVNNLLLYKNKSSVLSCFIDENNPYFNIVELTKNNQIKLSKKPKNKFYSRQYANKCFTLNGAVYGWTREELLKNNDSVVRSNSSLYLMDPINSIDINNELDFRIAKFLYSNSLKK